MQLTSLVPRFFLPTPVARVPSFVFVAVVGFVCSYREYHFFVIVVTYLLGFLVGFVSDFVVADSSAFLGYALFVLYFPYFGPVFLLFFLFLDS